MQRLISQDSDKDRYRTSRTNLQPNRVIKIRSMLQSKIAQTLPLSRHSIIEQVHNKIRMYMSSGFQHNTPHKPALIRRPSRSPTRRPHARHQSLTLTFSTVKQVAARQKQLKSLIFEAIDEKNDLRLLQICVRIVSISITEGWQGLMSACLVLFGWIFQEMRENQMSIYLLVKCVELCTVIRNDLLKGQALLVIAKNLRIIGRYEECLKCYKKCLQYLWRASRKTSEAQQLQIEVYQELSFALLHLNQLQQSEYFRNRYERGTVELRSSVIQKLSTDVLGHYERNISVIDKLTPQISVVLGVDFRAMDSKLNKQRFSFRKQEETVFKSQSNPLAALFDMKFTLMLQLFFADAEFKEEIPLPCNGSNQKLFAEIDAYIEKRNRKKFVEPVKYRIKSGGMDMFQKKSKARQMLSKKGHHIFNSMDRIPSLNKNYSTLQPAVIKTTSSRVVSKRTLNHHFANFIRRVQCL